MNFYLFTGSNEKLYAFSKEEPDISPDRVFKEDGKIETFFPPYYGEDFFKDATKVEVLSFNSNRNTSYSNHGDSSEVSS